jgi:hypothetical protein
MNYFGISRMEYRIKYLGIKVLIVVLGVLSVGVSGQAIADSVILSAMKHELARNMQSLVKKGYDKPFFISYTIADIKTAYASGSLGALTGSGENQYKDWNARVMVGDYSLNDENFVSNESQSSVSRVTHQMPIDDDYMGIRLALWSVTDNIYNSAATQYKQKKTLIKEDKVKEELLGISDFSKAEVVKKLQPLAQVNLDKLQLEKKAREYSRVFVKYPDIFNSNVTINQFYANIYFINSEGTEVTYPVQFNAIAVSAGTLTDKNESISRSLFYNSVSVNEWPDSELVISDIEKIVGDIHQSAKMEAFSDDYDGPVLYVGDVAANIFLSKLFSFDNKLVATRKPLKRKDQVGTYYDDSSTGKEWKVGKKVMSRDISIIDNTSMKKFGNTALWGAYSVDAEGVVPPDSLVLVENGFLKNKLNGRTPSKEVDSTNGHMRQSISYGGVQKSIAPGVVKVISSNPLPYNELKSKLIQMAKEEGLEYGILVKRLPVSASIAPVKIFKVMVETGEEIPIHAAKLATLDDKVFKDISGVSDSLVVYNTLFSGGVSASLAPGGVSSRSRGGMPISLIVPSAILFKEVDVEPVRIRYSNMRPIVPSPLLTGSDE